MFTDHQISILEGFLKGHVTLKIDKLFQIVIIHIISVFTLFFINKCTLGEYILLTPNFRTVVYMW